MNWLDVIRASRENLTQSSEKQDTVAKVDIFSEDVGKHDSLSRLEAAALATVLNDSTSELQILAMGSSAPTTTSSFSIRDNLVDVFLETVQSLINNSSFLPLFQYARNTASHMQEAQWLEEVAASNRVTLATLSAKLQGNQKTKQKELHKKQEVIATLKDQIQELARKRDVTLSYVDRLLTSKREQNLLRCENAEFEVKSQIVGVGNKATQEAGVHNSLVMFLNMAIEDLEEQQKKWSEYYDCEKTRRDEKILQLQRKIAEEKAKVAGLSDLYEEHQREINEYLEYKEQKRKEAEHEEFLYNNATKIQAWWRGTMVRRCLGPYKKKKKPAKDKKGKK